MPWLRALVARIRALVRRDAVIDDIREELAFHVQSRVEQYEREGLTPDDARRRARQRVGNVAVHIDRGYDIRGGGVMETVSQDVRYSLRLLRREKGFAAVALLTLALGIGASTAIFTVIDAALLRPMPYPHPEQLVRVLIESRSRDRARRGALADSVPALLRESGLFSDVAFWDERPAPAMVDGPVRERVRVRSISDSYINLYGARLALGRGFTADDLRAGSPSVAIVSYSYWTTRLSGDRDALGRPLRFEDGPATIVGVMPRGFQTTTTLWRPLRQTPGSDPNVLGRLRAGVMPADAEDRLQARVSGASVGIGSLLDEAVGDQGAAAFTISVAVGLILVIACVNVTGLLIARGASRTGELAVRASIGAGRGRLVRQLLTESTLLALVGGALGVSLAWLGLDVLAANIPLSVGEDATVAINGGVLAFSVALSIATGIAFGLAPAFRLTGRQLSGWLTRGRAQSGSPLTRRGGRLTIAIEIAVAVVLVLGGALTLRTFLKVVAVDLGFDRAALVTLEVAPVDSSPAVHAAYYPALIESLRQLPAIEAAAAVDYLPLMDSAASVIVHPPGGEEKMLLTRRITPGYFDAMGQRVHSGRGLTPDDAVPGRRGVVLSELAARKLFAGGEALGRHIQIGSAPDLHRIVGIVADVRHLGPRFPSEAGLYQPLAAVSFTRQPLTIVMRPRGRAPTLAADAKRAAESIGPPVVVERVRSGWDWLSYWVTRPRQRAVLLGLLGALGLVLSVVGVFGVTAYAVARRTREIGIRVALGALPRHVVGGMVRDAAWPIAIGVVVGLVAGAMATRAIAPFLFGIGPTDPTSFATGVGPTDPATFATVGAVLAAAGLLAAWVPARRAAQVDPVVALRSE